MLREFTFHKDLIPDPVRKLSLWLYVAPISYREYVENSFVIFGMYAKGKIYEENKLDCAMCDKYHSLEPESLLH